jgi:hypothetical protein
VISSLAVQYEGYVATAEFPCICGKASDEQKKLLNVLFEAADLQQWSLGSQASRLSPE